MTDEPKKISAEELIEAANVYGVIGIKIKECKMPLINPTGNHRRGLMLNDLTLVGSRVYHYLEPALKQLATARVAEREDFFDPEIPEIEKWLSTGLMQLALHF